MRNSALSLLFWVALFLTSSEAAKKDQRIIYEGSPYGYPENSCEWIEIVGPVECGWDAMISEECLEIGCNWIQNFNGPWCQHPFPKECQNIEKPTSYGGRLWRYIRLSIIQINGDQVTIGLWGLLALFIQVKLVIWAEKREAALSPKPKLKVEPAQEIDVIKVKKPQTSRTLRKRIQKKSETVEITPSPSSPRKSRRASSQPASWTFTDVASIYRASKVELQKEFEILKQAPTAIKAGLKRFYHAPDFVVCVVITFIAAFPRYWRLDYPSQVIYDEFHFGGFTNNYYNKEYFFDIHPPFAKLIFYYLSLLTSYEPSFIFTEINIPYDNWNQFMPLRYIAVTMGLFIPALMYMTCRNLSLSHGASIVVGLMWAWDTLILGESRIIVTDSQLILWHAIAIFFSMGMFSCSRDSPLFNVWTIFAALSCGAVFSIKFTALATLGMVFLEATFAFWIIDKPFSFPRLFVSLVMGISVLAWSFWVHFHLLENTGPDANFHDERFRSSLLGDQFYNPDSPKYGFPEKLVTIIYMMITLSAGILDPHSYSAKWYEWMTGSGKLMCVRIQHPDGPMNGYAEQFVVSSASFVYITLVALVVGALLISLYLRYRTFLSESFGAKSQRTAGLCTFFFIGYLTNMLPYIAVERTTFIYHYMPGLMYSSLLIGALVDFFTTAFAWGKRHRNIICHLLNALALFTLILYAPWVYPLFLTQQQHATRYIFQG